MNAAIVADVGADRFGLIIAGMDPAVERLRMVDQQIRARGVRDARVLDALTQVPRHLFVPDDLRHDAYADRPLPIGEGQTISQPYMVATMTEVLGLESNHHVLEVGTGSGYQTAILARLARQVVSIERHASLAALAAERLAHIGASNIRVIVGDGSRGYAAEAPYDRILVTAGAPVIPAALRTQLAEGGRLVIPVGSWGFQRLTVVERVGLEYRETAGEGCVFVPLVGEFNAED